MSVSSGAEKIELPGFELLEPLSTTTPPRLWKARQLSLDRVVALRLVPTDRPADSPEIREFLRTAHRAATIKQSGVVQLYTADVQDNLYYFAMEYVAGYSFGDWFRRKGKLQESDCLLVVEHVAKALRKVWDDAGMIHGAIEPHSIVINEEGEIRLANLGLARALEMESSAEAAERRASRAPFIAPELRDGGNGDCRADMYSLGACFFQALTGQPPLDPTATAVGAPPATWPDPRQFSPDVSLATVVLLNRMTQTDPQARYATWGDFLRDAAAIESQLLGARDTSAATEIGAPPRAVPVAAAHAVVSPHDAAADDAATMIDTNPREPPAPPLARKSDAGPQDHAPPSATATAAATPAAAPKIRVPKGQAAVRSRRRRNGLAGPAYILVVLLLAGLARQLYRLPNATTIKPPVANAARPPTPRPEPAPEPTAVEPAPEPVAAARPAVEPPAPPPSPEPTPKPTSVTPPERPTPRVPTADLKLAAIAGAVADHLLANRFDRALARCGEAQQEASLTSIAPQLSELRQLISDIAEMPNAIRDGLRRREGETVAFTVNGAPMKFLLVHVGPETLTGVHTYPMAVGTAKRNYTVAMEHLAAKDRVDCLPEPTRPADHAMHYLLNMEAKDYGRARQASAKCGPLADAFRKRATAGDAG